VPDHFQYLHGAAESVTYGCESHAAPEARNVEVELKALIGSTRFVDWDRAVNLGVVTPVLDVGKVEKCEATDGQIRLR